MVYCPRCGKQNPDDAKYCSNCGANLATGRYDANRQWDDRDRCGEECSGRSRLGVWFWGIIIILVGLWFIFEFGVKSISGLPSWVYNFQWGWIFAVVIGIAILIAGINVIRKGNRDQKDRQP